MAKAKPTAKKATARRSKPIAQAKAKPKTTTAKTTARTTALAVRRPDPNLPPSVERVNAISEELLSVIQYLEGYAANLRALDRQRHNGVGLRRQGFIEAALRLSSKFPQYFPHWLNTAKFQNDLDLFNAVRSLVEVCRSLEEKAWNINVEASDMVYTDEASYLKSEGSVLESEASYLESEASVLESEGSYLGRHAPPHFAGLMRLHSVNAIALLNPKQGKVVFYRIFGAEFAEFFGKFNNGFFVICFAPQKAQFAGVTRDMNVQRDV